jgi:hypothetical protein
MDLTPQELALTEAKIAKINERASKKGWTGRLVVEATAADRTTTNVAGFTTTEILFDVRIGGDAPKYDGWVFLATLDWDKNAGLTVRTAPGVVSVDRTGLLPGACAHCKTNRYRNHTYLLQAEDGKLIQVGSTCIKDFLGWNANPVWVTTPTDSDLESWGLTGRTDPEWATESVLAASWAATQTFGYIKADAYQNEGQPTKYTTLDILDPRTPAAKATAAKCAGAFAEAYGQAKIIRAFILSDAFAGDSEYVHNLKAIAAGEYCTYRNVGFLASAPVAWARATERDLRQKAAREDTLNEWAGTVGEKVTIQATVKSIRFIDGDYGVTTLYTLETPEHQSFKWFASRSALGTEADGKLLSLTGTIKSLEEFKGYKATRLTRVKVNA